MFIIIECFAGYEHAMICTDINGNNLFFESREEAEEAAKEYQQPVVVEI